jgi:hypothetical protein
MATVRFARRSSGSASPAAAPTAAPVARTQLARNVEDRGSSTPPPTGRMGGRWGPEIAFAEPADI